MSATPIKIERTYKLTPSLTEDAAWRDIAPTLQTLPDNVRRIWQYGFTEMFNNVIDHSGARRAAVELTKTASTTEISISDDGVGIFRKIQQALGLLDERHAVLELVKGKFTTDPNRHSGEGIFFTSRAFDEFDILSGNVFLQHQFGADEDWIGDNRRGVQGTLVTMSLANESKRRLDEVFAQFTNGDEHVFAKTVVPVKLAQFGDDNLVSRSQAKRLLARFDRFDTVLLDFSGVPDVGQAFADEIFRVFASHHPEVKLVEINANDQVAAMIARARSHT